MFDLADDYVWDFWLARDRDQWHLFHLRAPRSLGDPDLRHHHASVGHAVSTDLVFWRPLGDALGPGEPGSFDDLAVWTGCVVRDTEDGWLMFHSGLGRGDSGLRQRVGLATSSDMVDWTPVDWDLAADPRWYETLADGTWPDEHWRDPWVVRGEDGRWHMYLTARQRDLEAAPGRGVVGHATSHDLRTWQVQPPLSAPTGVFEQLEVLQLVAIDGRWVLVFSCLGTELHGRPDGSGGCWYVEVAGPGARVDVAAARRLLDERFYVAKLVERPDGGWGVMAFRNADDQGRFVGGIVDPMPISWDDDGHLVVAIC